jgi:peptidoglycan biosynthesis protein MviN/MurJ (putative lipid II flippase)
MTQLVFIRNNAYIIDLTLQQRKKVLVGALGVFVSIGMSIALIPSLGITGLCLGMIAGRLILSLAYPRMVNAYLGQTTRWWCLSGCRPWLVTILLFAASAGLGQRFQADGWLEWAVFAGSTFSIMMAVAIMTGLKREKRALLFRRVKKMR